MVGEKKIVPHWYEIFCSCLLWAHNSVTKDAVLIDFFYFFYLFLYFAFGAGLGGGSCMAGN